jgi:hypothetical protein
MIIGIEIAYKNNRGLNIEFYYLDYDGYISYKLKVSE